MAGIGNHPYLVHYSHPDGGCVQSAVVDGSHPVQTLYALRLGDDGAVHPEVRQAWESDTGAPGTWHSHAVCDTATATRRAQEAAARFVAQQDAATTPHDPAPDPARAANSAAMDPLFQEGTAAFRRMMGGTDANPPPAEASSDAATPPPPADPAPSDDSADRPMAPQGGSGPSDSSGDSPAPTPVASDGGSANASPGASPEGDYVLTACARCGANALAHDGPDSLVCGACGARYDAMQAVPAPEGGGGQ